MLYQPIIKDARLKKSSDEFQGSLVLDFAGHARH
jgi:hypothetical protein